MTTPGEEILALWHERRSGMGFAFNRMEEITRLYNGDLALPLPQVDKIEKAAVANLIQQGIDQLGARVASVRPAVDCPSAEPGQPMADKKARNRRLAIMGWWDKSMMDVLDGRRARHLLAYASSPSSCAPATTTSTASRRGTSALRSPPSRARAPTPTT